MSEEQQDTWFITRTLTYRMDVPAGTPQVEVQEQFSDEMPEEIDCATNYELYVPTVEQYIRDNFGAGMIPQREGSERDRWLDLEARTVVGQSIIKAWESMAPAFRECHDARKEILEALRKQAQVYLFG